MLDGVGWRGCCRHVWGKKGKTKEEGEEAKQTRGKDKVRKITRKKLSMSKEDVSTYGYLPTLQVSSHIRSHLDILRRLQFRVIFRLYVFSIEIQIFRRRKMYWFY